MNSIPKTRTRIDVLVIDIYLPLIGPSAFLVYSLLARHAAASGDLQRANLNLYSGLSCNTIKKSLQVLETYKLIEAVAGKYKILPIDESIALALVEEPKPSRRAVLLNGQGNTCYYCGCTLTLRHAQIDHKQPRSKGGSNKTENLVVCCPSCNQAKSSTPYNEFMAKIKAES